MKTTPVYLDSYIIQADMRIRIPKSVITNWNAVPGKTRVSFYYDQNTQSIILRVCNDDCSGSESDKDEVKNNG